MIVRLRKLETHTRQEQDADRSRPTALGAGAGMMAGSPANARRRTTRADV
jgi:hypothetical protein